MTPENHSAATRRSTVFAAGIKHLVEIRRIPPGLTVYSEQQPVYIVGTDHISPDHRVLISSGPDAWRLFAGSANGTAVIGELSTADNPELLSLAYGKRADEILAINLNPEFSARFRTAEFERRTLRLPDQFVEALWFKSIRTNDDTIVPLGLRFGTMPKSGFPIDSVPYLELATGQS